MLQRIKTIKDPIRNAWFADSNDIGSNQNVWCIHSQSLFKAVENNSVSHTLCRFFFLWFLYISQQLDMVLLLSVTPALLCSNKRHKIIGPRMTLKITNLTTAFLLVKEKNTPRKPRRHDQKAAKNNFRDDYGSHPLSLGFEPTTTEQNAE